MALKDYIAMEERCSNCSFCKFVPFDVAKSIRFGDNCPSGCYNNFNTAFARGRFQLGLAIAREEIGYTAETTRIIHECMSCGACDVSCKVCRYNLEPLEHNIALKNDAIKAGHILPGQKKMIKSLEEEKTLMPGKKKANRLAWLGKLEVKDAMKKKAEVLFFPGCRYSYDRKLFATAQGALKIVMATGADVGILGDADMCCAGRAYQMGFFDEFKAAAKANVKAIKKTGAKMIVTPCADCYHAFKRLYPELGLDVEVLHITEYIERAIDEGKLSFSKKLGYTVTYHDPCHLGRQGEPYVAWNGKEKKIRNQIHTWEPRRPRYIGFYGIYDAPRKIIAATGCNLEEMERIKEYAWCCGAGSGCSEHSPELSAFTANERIEEAKATGAQMIVTACPWCKGNFEKAGGMEVKDILELVLEAM